MATQKLNIIIADDHPILCKGLKDIFYNHPMVGQVQLANDGESLLKLMKLRAADLVLLDINMPPGKDGIEMAAIIKAKYKKTKVMILSTFVTPEYIYQCHEIKVDAYLNKTANADEIKKAFKCVMDGEQFYSPDVKNILLKRLALNDHARKHYHRKNEMSSREIEILILICKKKDYKQIAGILFISENTVRKHRQNLMLKTNSHNVTDLYEYALKHEIIPLP